METKLIEIALELTRDLKNEWKDRTAKEKENEIVRTVEMYKSGNHNFCGLYLCALAIDFENGEKIIKTKFPEYRQAITDLKRSARQRSRQKSPVKSQDLLN